MPQNHGHINSDHVESSYLNFEQAIVDDVQIRSMENIDFPSAIFLFYNELSVDRG